VRHVAASYRLKDAAVRLHWKGRPLGRDAAVRAALASDEPPVLEARLLAQPRPTPAPHGPNARGAGATASTALSKRRRPDDDQLRPSSRRRRATDDSLDSCSSEGYPMSDYEDCDEPLYAKPLLAAHKAPLVPSWARELSNETLRRQASVDPFAVFEDPTSQPVDLKAILGRSPVPPKRKRAQKEALEATSPDQWPSVSGGGTPVDITLVVLAGDTLRSPLDSGGVVRRGAEYATIMRDVDTFGNLRRHYAKHHGLKESELALWSRRPGKADVRLALDSCARDYHLRGTATVIMTVFQATDERRSRLVPRRLSASLSDESSV